ncbi:MAG TPA: hypothetical protein VN894_14795 [Polyangiaceae bacterium]|nr:hypothetical protein [Polyangiaceae bacterium]
MNRSVDARVADVRRLLAAARTVYADRARIAPRVARCTGLTSEGVELGFESLERDANDADLRALVAGAGNAERVHAILSANVFVGPLRALAIARATADRVTVRPSPRDPVIAQALVEAAADAAIAVVAERDVASVASGEIHVYGRDETLAAVRARALSFAHMVDECLRAWGRRVPRGVLFDSERGDATRWRDTMDFAGRVWAGDHHMVALGAAGAPLPIPPPGRHLYVAPEATLHGVTLSLTPIARFVVAVGADDPAAVQGIAPAHARVMKLGHMQRPALDGPVDRRPF